MLDVIHYYYEEDMNYSTMEQMQMVEARRIHIFEQLYNQTYNYRLDHSNSRADNSDGSISKPYIPPTPIDESSSLPFGDILDSPLS